MENNLPNVVTHQSFIQTKKFKLLVAFVLLILLFLITLLGYKNYSSQKQPSLTNQPDNKPLKPSPSAKPGQKTNITIIYPSKEATKPATIRQKPAQIPNMEIVSGGSASGTNPVAKPLPKP